MPNLKKISISAQLNIESFALVKFKKLEVLELRNPTYDFNNEQFARVINAMPALKKVILITKDPSRKEKLQILCPQNENCH